MKCGYTHCKHDSNIITGEYKKSGNRYYHPDCYYEKENIQAITTLFLEQVNERTVISTLKAIVNNLIFKQGYQADYVLYAVQYAVSHPQIRLTYPQGLYRVCGDKEIRQSWDKLKAGEITKNEKVELTEEMQLSDTSDVLYSTPKTVKSVSDMFT